MDGSKSRHSAGTNRGSKSRRSLRSETGQAFAIVTVGVVSLIGLGAFVMDIGGAFRSHRHAQAAADASALAAAQMLPSSTSLASQASSQVGANNFSDGTLAVSYGSTQGVANDTVTVQASTSSPSFLGKVLNFSSFSERASATARVGSYLGWSDNIAPWVIDQQSLTWGQVVQFKVESGNQESSGNFGAARLPIKEGACAQGGGGSDYRDLIANVKHSCLVEVSDQLNPETGNLAGPTSQGLQDRGTIQNFDPYSILKQLPNGEYVLTTYSHTNLVVIPVIDEFHPGNSSPFNVVGFAWFIITKYTNKTVDGMFIGSSAPGGAKCSTPSGPAACPTGAYNALGFKVIELYS